MTNTLSRFARWALGLYGPAAPDDLRLTDIEPRPRGLSEVRSRKAVIPAERSARLITRQQRQHDRLNELQLFVGEHEIGQGQP